MAEFDNNDPNLNNNYNDNGINNQSQYNKVPEYSFWAEQVQGNPYSNNNQAQGNPYPNNNHTLRYPYSNNNQVQGTSYPNNNQTQGYPYSNNNQSQGYPYSNNNQTQGYPYSNNNQTQGYPYSNNQGANGWANTNNMPNGNYYYGNQYADNPYGNNMNNQYNNNMNNMKNKPDKKADKKPGPGSKVLKFLGKAACFGVIAGVSFLGFQKLYNVISPDTSIESAIDAVEEQNHYEISNTELGAVKVLDPTSVSEVTKNTLPSIVSINSTATPANDIFGQSYELQGSGSGIIVGETEKELLVATNNHVVEGTDSIKVTFTDGTEADAIIKGTDATADLAVVTVDISTLSKETLNSITVAKLGNSDEVKVGEMSIAIGNALGYGQSVTVGYISAKDREVDVSDGYNTKKMILLQTDAAINPGNSGGALLNAKGEVIGINTVKYSANEVEGMGYAIPISVATPIITELMSREILTPEEQGFLGISGGDVTEQDAASYNMPVGVFVNEISAGGAAEKAGLLSGDVITKVDDIEVTSISQLREYVNSRRAGTEVQITYMRDTNGEYVENTITVTLGQNPNLVGTTK